jgi:hypothetical protein
MPNMSNPEAFQFEAAVILAGAYTAFPMPFACSHDADNQFYPTNTGQSRRDIQFQTITWLVAHDYLSDEGGMIGGQWTALRLTERGLNILNSIPDVLSGKEPLGKRLVVAVAKGSFDVIKQLIPTVIQQAIGGP